MGKMTISVSLTGAEQKELAGRYHFSGTELPRIGILYEAVMPLIRPQVFYHVTERAVLCAATLGNGIDLLQELYGQAQAVSDVYILECIGSTLLEKTYGMLDDLVRRESGLLISAYEFPGSDIPIEKMQEILQNLSKGEENFPISCNSSFALTPKKSVVFLGRPGEKGQNCSVCASCPRTDCPDRRTAGGKNGDGGPPSAAREETEKRRAENYNYGYRRIFGNDLNDLISGCGKTKERL